MAVKGSRHNVLGIALSTLAGRMLSAAGGQSEIPPEIGQAPTVQVCIHWVFNSSEQRRWERAGKREEKKRLRLACLLWRAAGGSAFCGCSWKGQGLG